MNRIPGKVAHRKAATKADLLSLLVEREIGYCTADKTAYMRVDGELRKLGGSDIATPTTISLLMGFEEDAEKYTYDWKSLESLEPIPNNPLKLWSRLAGMGLYAEVSSKDSKGREIANTLDNKTDATDMTPGTYTKVSVNEQGAVTNGGVLEASDLPTHEHSAEDITHGHLNPDRLGDNSIPAEKLEIRKRLVVDGISIVAVETPTSVILYSRFCGWSSNGCSGTTVTYDPAASVHDNLQFPIDDSSHNVYSSGSQVVINDTNDAATLLSGLYVISGIIRISRVGAISSASVQIKLNSDVILGVDCDFNNSNFVDISFSISRCYPTTTGVSFLVTSSATIEAYFRDLTLEWHSI